MVNSEQAHRAQASISTAAWIAVAALIALLGISLLAASSADARRISGKARAKASSRQHQSREVRRWHSQHGHGSTPAPAPKPTPTPTPTPESNPVPTEPTPSPEPEVPAPEKETAPDPGPIPTQEPEPETSPTPESSPSSDLLFKATKISDFWLTQSAPGAITEAPDPAGSGQKVFKLTVSDNDVYPITPTENPRAEMLSPSTITAGQEFWWSAKFFLPSNSFPASTPNFVTLLQGPYGKPWEGTPPFHIEENGGVLKWQRNSTYNWDIPWQIPLVRDQWVEVMIHEKFARAGFVEMWVDGKQVTFFSNNAYNPNHVAPTTRLNMATQDDSNDENTSSLYAMSYRKKGMLSSLTVYQGPLSMGKTRASVEG